jgi:hypothetical protein
LNAAALQQYMSWRTARAAIIAVTAHCSNGYAIYLFIRSVTAAQHTAAFRLWLERVFDDDDDDDCNIR